MYKCNIWNGVIEWRGHKNWRKTIAIILRYYSSGVFEWYIGISYRFCGPVAVALCKCLEAYLLQGGKDDKRYFVNNAKGN